MMEQYTFNKEVFLTLALKIRFNYLLFKIEDTNRNLWLFHLGFRQIKKWIPFHHFGREAFLSPIIWTNHGLFLARKNRITLLIQFNNECYHFFLVENGTQISLGKASTRYLSSEMAGGFTGVFFGLYAIDSEENRVGTFHHF